MSSTLPGGATRAASADPSSLPQRQGMRLHQLLDVSSAPTQEGDSLVYKDESGMWEPIHLPTGPGEVVEEMLADGAVTTYKIAEDAVTLSRMADNSVDTAELNDNSVTDPKIGTRTPSQAESLTSGIGTITELFGKLATMVKNITGKASWLTPPAITLEALVDHSARHATGGADAITPASIEAAHETHTHPDATNSASGFLSASNKLKLDSVSLGAAALTNTAPSSLAISQATYVGNDTQAARADHAHSIPGLATTAVSGFMSSSDKLKLDAAPLPSSSTPDALDVSQAGSAGSSSTVSRSDHRHQMPGLVSTTTHGFMSSTDKTKLNGIATGAAGLTGSTPDALSIGQAGSVGSSSSAARGDHAHSLPGYATTSVGGFMSAADKIKLNDVLDPKYYSTKPTADYTLPAGVTTNDWMEISLSSAEVGYYLVTVVVDLDWQETDDTVVFSGRLILTTSSAGSAGNSPQVENMIFMSTAVPVRLTLSQTWIVNHSTATTRYLYFNVGKTGSGGSTSRLRRLHSHMHAVKIG